jgi:hypothetical protein
VDKKTLLCFPRHVSVRGHKIHVFCQFTYLPRQKMSHMLGQSKNSREVMMNHLETIMNLLKAKKSESGSEEMNGLNPDKPRVG